MINTFIKQVLIYYIILLPITVRPTDLDIKGHVNNARYMEYYQHARWNWLEQHSIKESDLGIRLVVVRAEIDFKAEINYPNELNVETDIVIDGEKKIVFNQTIKLSDGTIASQAKIIMLAVDTTTKRSIPVPTVLKEAINHD